MDEPRGRDAIKPVTFEEVLDVLELADQSVDNFIESLSPEEVQAVLVNDREQRDARNNRNYIWHRMSGRQRFGERAHRDKCEICAQAYASRREAREAATVNQGRGSVRDD